MDNYSRTIKREIEACVANKISDCGLTNKDIEGLVGNPAGTAAKDFVNPAYVGKISVKDDKVFIRLAYCLTGHQSRAKAALKNISAVFKAQKIIIEFTENKDKYDLRIHGASLGDLAEGLKSCTCDGMLQIGGWGPHYSHYKWGNALLVNPHVHQSYWKMSDAHEFGHKLGLRHRNDRGIMSYWDEEKYRRDPRRILPSDRARIVGLYAS
jgi:hypothetical protein